LIEDVFNGRTDSSVFVKLLFTLFALTVSPLETNLLPVDFSFGIPPANSPPNCMGGPPGPLDTGFEPTVDPLFNPELFFAGLP
jgi:hypothetical protein